ncbi:hypothetical protein L226DRAFT_386275 [Lentinus tigrinus ALCF2SS1-7]|uniref:uncharacterized protein n=1 Tax=Lentinus tigrinus ALCF2SS1-7 TaxID=1328758 RepID=UPI00116617D8|nr:hypothetical protein L226DRAFT_401169 [Lentinus tigrinus ALCF2SS1-7]RPD67842.1 hypothetical protein L226DRAFT_386275 [Lentinus tigrinus ALCF2SS1-7]
MQSMSLPLSSELAVCNVVFLSPSISVWRALVHLSARVLLTHPKSTRRYLSDYLLPWDRMAESMPGAIGTRTRLPCACTSP